MVDGEENEIGECCFLGSPWLDIFCSWVDYCSGNTPLAQKTLRNIFAPSDTEASEAISEVGLSCHLFCLKQEEEKVSYSMWKS